MRKVYQNETGRFGNCQSAVLATLLNLDLKEVPNFNQGISGTMSAEQAGQLFRQNMSDFLRPLGYDVVQITSSDPEFVINISRLLDTKVMVGGLSPRGYMHAAIYYQGELWHDPNPSGGGLIPQIVTLLVPIL